MSLENVNMSSGFFEPPAGDGLVSVIDATSILGLNRKQHLFKVLKRLGIDTQKERCSAHAGQAIAYITVGDLERVREHLDAQRNGAADTGGSAEVVSTERGWFYLIQLEPQHDPARFKVGFASDMKERLRHLRCSAPFAKVVHKWRCKRLWEKTAIEYVAAGCAQLHTEVFRSDSIDGVRERCEAFFGLMGPLTRQ
ncbi:MAG: hypothetical protein NTY65_16385 [Planctomycetota bacterium]|nr:hypothetical protein [Planctomycetota bacterium]